MLQQGLHFEIILTFNLNGLRWSSGRASRDVFIQLGHMKDVVDLLEPAFEVKSIGRLFYALHHLEWSHKPSSELPSTCKVEFFEESSNFSPTRCSYGL